MIESMEEQRITIKIAGKEYSLSIDSSKEESIRKAADRLNMEIEALQYDYHGPDLKDILSIVLLSEEQKLVEMETKSNSEINNTIHSLEEIDRMLGEYLSSR